MAEYLDFFNVYVVESVELLFQFCFLARILKRKVRLPFLFLFAVCGAFVTQIASYRHSRCLDDNILLFHPALYSLEHIQGAFHVNRFHIGRLFQADRPGN